jgi:hypothetical protein
MRFLKASIRGLLALLEVKGRENPDQPGRFHVPISFNQTPDMVHRNRVSTTCKRVDLTCVLIPPANADGTDLISFPRFDLFFQPLGGFIQRGNVMRSPLPDANHRDD